MGINLLNSKWPALALWSLGLVSGCCCQAVPLPGETQCPTDARRIYMSCGEEAVRRCPCGPGHEFYGLKPTCWREWPEGWHCNGCEGSAYVDRETCGAPVVETPVAEEPAPVREEVDISNPFRSKGGAAELPSPPKSPVVAPTQPPAPVRLTPTQPTPTAPPALEKPPVNAAPTKSPSAEAAPALPVPKPDKATAVVVALANSPVEKPPAGLIKQVEATVPLPMPIVPAAVKITAAPILMAPLNAPAIVFVEEPQPKPAEAVVQPAQTKAEKKAAETAAKKDSSSAPALSKRVEQHLNKNIEL